LHPSDNRGGHLGGPDHRPACRAGPTAAIGDRGDIHRQQRHEPVHVAGRSRGQELLGDARALLGIDRLEPLTSRVHMRAGAVCHLPHRSRGFAHPSGDFVV